MPDYQTGISKRRCSPKPLFFSAFLSFLQNQNDQKKSKNDQKSKLNINKT